MRVRGYAYGVPCWAELASADPSAAVEFYHALFGWRYDPGESVFQLGGSAVAGLVANPSEPAGWLTYLASDDLAGLFDLVVDSGGAVLAPPMEVAGRGRA